MGYHIYMSLKKLFLNSSSKSIYNNNHHILFFQNYKRFAVSNRKINFKMNLSTSTSTTLESVIDNYKNVLQKINEKSETLKLSEKPTLVAVSKTKPADLVQLLYDNGQRHFGENYVQELFEKSKHLSKTCPEIKWHFIGHVQSNKVKILKDVDNLYAVETVDSEKLANKFNTAFKDRKEPLNLFIQVNTSGEESKSGVNPKDCLALAKKIELLEHVKLVGFMTIGAIGNSADDFDCLRQCRDDVATALGVETKSFGLSMGMSSDFEEAIEHGSTNL